MPLPRDQQPKDGDLNAISLDEIHERIQSVLDKQQKIISSKDQYFHEQESILLSDKSIEEKKSEFIRVQNQIHALDLEYGKLEEEYQPLEQMRNQAVNADLNTKKKSDAAPLDRFEQLKQNLPDLPPIPAVASSPVVSDSDQTQPIADHSTAASVAAANSSAPSANAVPPVSSSPKANAQQGKPKTVGDFIQAQASKYIDNTIKQFVGTIGGSKASNNLIKASKLMEAAFFVSLAKSGMSGKVAMAISYNQPILEYLDPWKLINPFCWLQSVIRSAYTGAAFGIDSIPGLKSKVEGSTLVAKIVKGVLLSPFILAGSLLDVFASWPYQIANIIRFSMKNKGKESDKKIEMKDMSGKKKSDAQHSTSHVYQDGLHAKPVMDKKVDLKIEDSSEKPAQKNAGGKVKQFFLDRARKKREKKRAEKSTFQK